ncbi:MAG: DivIVA domain-containing protein [Nocardioidaceae bacterium]|nr:DivIVA domain-containing protein [Nocardioidaceae bacterium]
MPLTPEDVHKKTFTPVRLREGYDMGEVDQFLDEVEVELKRLLEDNEDLRSKLAAATGGTPDVKDVTESASKATPAGPTKEGAAPAVGAVPVVRTVPEASGAAARLLEIAAQNADQLVAEAHDDADKIIGEARAKAERLESEAKAQAEKLEADTSSRSERLDSEIMERRQQLFGQLERDRDNLARELEDLRAFEREYRSRLKSYFQSQLEALDSKSDGEVPSTPSADGETPHRLRELLGDAPQT